MKILFIPAGILLCVAMSVHLCAQTILFGPETFLRETGGPTEFIQSFEACTTDGNVMLTLMNGDSAGENRVSSARILINGKEVISTKDFNQNVDVIERPISALQSQNTLQVQLNSGPGGQVELTVATDASCGLSIKITQPGDAVNLVPRCMTVKGIIESEDPDIRVMLSGRPVLLDMNHSGTASDPFLFFAKIVTGEGDFQMVAEVEDSEGNKDSDVRDLTCCTTDSYVLVTPTEKEVMVGNEVTFAMETNYEPTGMARIDFNGDGTWDETFNSFPEESTFTFDSPGIYWTTLQVMVNGFIRSDTTSIKVFTEEELVQTLAEKWEAFRAALLTGDMDLIQSFYTYSCWQKHQKAIQMIIDNGDIESAVAGMANLSFKKYYGGFAEFLIIHDQDGQPTGNFVYFSRMQDGQWLISEF